MMLVASGLIVQMVFWMRRHGRTLKRELEQNMQKNASAANWWAGEMPGAFPSRNAPGTTFP
jgi:high-affinity Fe2+/Pb2+ permease